MTPSRNSRREEQMGTARSAAEMSVISSFWAPNILAATRGSRRKILAWAAGALTASAGGLLVPGLRQEAAAGHKGVRVTINPNGVGPSIVEGWVKHEKNKCGGTRCRTEDDWHHEWDPRPVGPDQQETFDTGAHELALLFSPPGGAEPFILGFSNPFLGRPDATVGIGTISAPKGPKYTAYYLNEKGLSEGESVTAANLFRIERRDDDTHKDRKVFVITIGA
jgi:hypothetical protein